MIILLRTVDPVQIQQINLHPTVSGVDLLFLFIQGLTLSGPRIFKIILFQYSFVVIQCRFAGILQFHQRLIVFGTFQVLYQFLDIAGCYQLIDGNLRIPVKILFLVI